MFLDTGPLGKTSEKFLSNFSLLKCNEIEWIRERDAATNFNRMILLESYSVRRTPVCIATLIPIFFACCQSADGKLAYR